jgi:hypothetical protein
MREARAKVPGIAHRLQVLEDFGGAAELFVEHLVGNPLEVAGTHVIGLGVDLGIAHGDGQGEVVVVDAGFMEWSGNWRARRFEDCSAGMLGRIACYVGRGDRLQLARKWGGLQARRSRGLRQQPVALCCSVQHTFLTARPR